MLKNTVKKFLNTLSHNRLTTIAGAWVYYFLTSVIPLAFLLITAFGVFGVNISTEVVSRLPEEFRPAGEVIASTAENASNGVTVFFIITVIFSCSTLLNQMSKDGDFIYGMNSKIKRGVMRRIFAIVALGALFIVFLGAAFLFAFGSMLFAGRRVDGALKLIVTILVFLVIILFAFIVILLLNRFIAPIRLKFRDMVFGSFISLFIVVIGTIGLALYLRLFNNYNAFYGSLAAIVVFLLWTYILMLGLVFGVIVNMEICKKSVKSF